MAFSTASDYILNSLCQLKKKCPSQRNTSLHELWTQSCNKSASQMYAAYIMVCGLSQSKSETRPWAPWALLIDPLLLKQMQG